MKNQKVLHASVEYCLLFQAGGADLGVFLLEKTCISIFRSKHQEIILILFMPM